MLSVPCALLRHARSLRTLAPKPAHGQPAAHAYPGCATSQHSSLAASPISCAPCGPSNVAGGTCLTSERGGHHSTHRFTSSWLGRRVPPPHRAALPVLSLSTNGSSPCLTPVPWPPMPRLGVRT